MDSYTNDFTEVYGYNTLFSRPSYIEDFFSGKVKYSNVRYTEAQLKDAAKYFRGNPDKNIYYSNYGIVFTRDMVLFYRGGNSEGFYDVFTKEIGSGENLWWRYPGGPYQMLVTQLVPDIKVLHKGEVPEDMTLIDTTALNITSVADFLAKLPLLGYDPVNDNLYKLPRKQIVSNAVKFLLERELMQNFGNPGEYLSVMSSAINYLLNPKTAEYPSAFLEQNRRILEIKDKVYAEVENKIPSMEQLWL